MSFIGYHNCIAKFDGWFADNVLIFYLHGCIIESAFLLCGSLQLQEDISDDFSLSGFS